MTYRCCLAFARAIFNNFLYAMHHVEKQVVDVCERCHRHAMQLRIDSTSTQACRVIQILTCCVALHTCMRATINPGW